MLQNRYGEKLPCELISNIIIGDEEVLMLFHICLTVTHTRVHLRPFGSQCSDYINASFVEVRLQ